MKNKDEEIEAPETNGVSAEQAERRALAEAIATAGSYLGIREAFAKSPGLLKEMTNDLKRREAFLITEAPYLSESDWMILTCLELFDRATFEHCERTWGLAKEKLESTASVGLYFRELLNKEGLSVESVLRACLLHDCGKMCLNKQILNDMHTDEEWTLVHEQFCARTYAPEVAGQKMSELTTYLAEHPGHRAIHKVSYEELGMLGDAERQTIEEMRAKGVDVALPLAELIATHQKHSGEILESENPNDPAVGLVARHHSDNPVSKEQYPSGLSIVRVGVTLSTELGRALDVLRLSDIYDAYHSARIYKPGHPDLAALEYLLCEADRGVIDPNVAREWVGDSVASLDKEEYFSYFAEYVEQAELEGTRSPADLDELKRELEEEQVAHKKLRARGII